MPEALMWFPETLMWFYANVFQPIFRYPLAHPLLALAVVVVAMTIIFGATAASRRHQVKSKHSNGRTRS